MCKLAGVDPTDTVTIAGAQRPICDRSVSAPTTLNCRSLDDCACSRIEPAVTTFVESLF